MVRGRWLWAVIVVMAACLALPSGAPAASGPQYGKIGRYGEVWRGGGFDATAYDGGRYDKPLTPGKLIDPVGFAVDTQDPTAGGDGTALYVLDRTSNLPAAAQGARTSWRLQKLSDTGAVLGTDRFTLPADASSYEMLGLSVDPAQGRIYALVIAFDPDNFGVLPNGAAECVAEIVSWSTTPDASHHLAPPTGLSADALARGATGFPAPGALSTETQMIPGGDPQGRGLPRILQPQGLALDVVGTTHYLAVQGADDNPGDISIGNIAASGIAQVCTSSACGKALSGAVSKQWSANVLSGLTNDVGESGFLPAGISTAPDGRLTILLDEASGVSPSNLDVVAVPADLTATPTILSSLVNGVQNPDLASSAFDDAAVFANDSPPNLGDPDGASAGTVLASAQVVGLSNGLFAGEFEPGTAGQPDPQNPSGAPSIWTHQSPGVRLLSPEADGTLSNPDPPLTSLFDTLGNPAANQSGHTETATACNVSDAATAASIDAGAAPVPSLAAGAGGRLWLLTRGLDSSTGADPAVQGGRELIELAPGGAGAPCPAPSGTFTVAAAGGTPMPASDLSPLIVRVGGTVSFDAASIDNRGAASEQYVWDFGDRAGDSVLGSAVPPFRWPTTTGSHTYTTVGTYTASLTVFGDFGAYKESGSIEVITGTLPSASFAWDAQSLAVSFDGSASTPSPGATVLSYEWSWGDGQIDNTATPTDTHAYGAPGPYDVWLTVLDSHYARSAPVKQTVTVSAPPPMITTTTPPPVKPPPGPPALGVRFGRTASSRGLLALTLSCPAVQTSCAGTLVIRTARRVVPGLSRRARAHARKRVLVLARARFSIPGGRTERITVALSRGALTLLGRSHGVRAIATLSARNPQGQASTATHRLALRIAARHRHRHRRAHAHP